MVNMEDINYYATLPLDWQVSSAIGMIKEITDESDRAYCVASALVQHLSPREKEDDVDIVALRLAEVLRNMLQDSSQNYRLHDCLSAMVRT